MIFQKLFSLGHLVANIPNLMEPQVTICLFSHDIESKLGRQLSPTVTAHTQTPTTTSD